MNAFEHSPCCFASAPAMKEAAAAFGAARRLRVEVTAGPTPEWADRAKQDADVAQAVALEKEFRIYRDAGVVVTQRGKQNPAAQSFVDFLKSADGRRIFAKWGWMAGRP